MTYERFLTLLMDAPSEYVFKIGRMYGQRHDDPMEKRRSYVTRLFCRVKEQGVYPEAAAMLGEPDEVKSKYETPTAKGFYWAKWRLPEHTHIKSMSDTWEVVEVWENSLDDAEHLLVHVAGVAESQALDAFVWGPGPLAGPT